MKRISTILAALVLGCSMAHAASGEIASDDYLDNRTDAVTLVRSLYNAINRKEYARAYGYFATPPADSLDAFAKGYADTKSVDLATGDPRAEGAAGSTYYTLPVAIGATMSDGSTLVFAGCYTLRLAQPTVQGVPYKPLRIEKGSLSPVDGKSLKEAVPGSCKTGDAAQAEPASDNEASDATAKESTTDPALSQARAQFTAVYAKSCRGSGTAQAQIHDIAFNYASDAQDRAKRQARLYVFPCGAGSGKTASVYFLADEDGRVTPLRFATPELDIRYRNDDPRAAVEEIIPLGYTTVDRLADARYDERTYTLIAHDQRPGPKAMGTGMWIFRSGTFSLVKYEIDASHDGKANPETVLDYNSGP